MGFPFCAASVFHYLLFRCSLGFPLGQPLHFFAFFVFLGSPISCSLCMNMICMCSLGFPFCAACAFLIFVFSLDFPFCAACHLGISWELYGIQGISKGINRGSRHSMDFPNRAVSSYGFPKGVPRDLIYEGIPWDP